MKALLTFALLIVATGLEAGGDAVARTGLRSTVLSQKVMPLGLDERAPDYGGLRRGERCARKGMTA